MAAAIWPMSWAMSAGDADGQNRKPAALFQRDHHPLRSTDPRLRLYQKLTPLPKRMLTQNDAHKIDRQRTFGPHTVKGQQHHDVRQPQLHAGHGKKGRDLPLHIAQDQRQRSQQAIDAPACDFLYLPYALLSGDQVNSAFTRLIHHFHHHLMGRQTMDCPARLILPISTHNASGQSSLRDRCAPIHNLVQQVCAADPLRFPDHLLRIQSIGTSYFSCSSDLHRAARTAGQNSAPGTARSTPPTASRSSTRSRSAQRLFCFSHPLRPPHAVQAAPFYGAALKYACMVTLPFPAEGFGSEDAAYRTILGALAAADAFGVIHPGYVVPNIDGLHRAVAHALATTQTARRAVSAVLSTPFLWLEHMTMGLGRSREAS